MIPRQFDVLWINAEPHAGHEMGGHNPKTGNQFRPFVVCSNYYFNQSGSVVGLAVTSHKPLNRPKISRMLLPINTVGHRVHGYIVPLSMYGYDYHARNGKIIDHLSKDTIRKVILIVRSIFNYPGT